MSDSSKLWLLDNHAVYNSTSPPSLSQSPYIIYADATYQRLLSLRRHYPALPIVKRGAFPILDAEW